MDRKEYLQAFLEYEIDGTPRDQSSTPHKQSQCKVAHEMDIPQEIELPPQNRYGKAVVWMLKPRLQEGIPGAIEQGNCF